MIKSRGNAHIGYHSHGGDEQEAEESNPETQASQLLEAKRQDIVDQKIAWTGFAGSEFKLRQRSYWLHSIRIGVIKCRAAFLIFGQLQIGFIGCTRSLKGLNIKANRTFALADR